jgi:hypothetical protein
LADGKQHVSHHGTPSERGNRERDLEGAERRRIEVSAGGGQVVVRVDGRGRIRHLAIDPAAFEGRDAELLADLILGAVAEAERLALDVVEGGPTGSR